MGGLERDIPVTRRFHIPCTAAPRVQRGFLLMTAVVLIVVVALLISAMVYLSATNTESGAGNLQAGQALFITDSGLDYGQRQLAQDTDWYRDTSDPAIMTDGTCPPSTVTLNLGQGTFTVCTNKPATMLRRRMASASTAVCVYTVDRFPTSGYVQIDDDISPTGSAEFVHYTGTTASAASCGNQPALTGIARNQTISSITGTMGDHERDTYVYPVTTLQGGGLPNSCATPSSFQIADNSKFLSAGTIALDDGGTNYEQIVYTGSSRSGGVMTLTGVQRCQNTTMSAAWPGGFPVTPVTAQPSNSVRFETEISSTGSVSGAVRMERKTVQR